MAKITRPILVSGATGHQGGAVLRHLRTKGIPVRVLTRDPDTPAARQLMGPHTEIVRGDMNDLASLRRAAEGAYGVFSVQASDDLEAEVRQGINLVEAARLEVVDHLVYSSLAGAGSDDGVPHLRAKARIEEHLHRTGLPCTILRPVFFMENWFRQKERIDEGVLSFPFESASNLQMITVDDIGALVALAFEHRGHWTGRIVEIAGDERPMLGIAEAFGHLGAREVKYQQMTWDEFERQTGHDLMLLFQWFERSRHRADIDTLRREYPNLTSFVRWLNLNWRQSVRAPVTRGA